MKERTDGRTNERTNKQTNKQTNVSCWRRHGFIPRFHVSFPTLLRAKGDDSELSLVFNKTKNSFWFWGMPLRICWRAWRSWNHILCSHMRSDHRTRQQTRRQLTSEHLTHCIRVRGPGFPWRDILPYRDRLLGPALIRTSFAKRPGRFDGDCRLVRLSPVIIVTYPY